jgi:uncharacterized protein (DUF433 family)
MEKKQVLENLKKIDDEFIDYLDNYDITIENIEKLKEFSQNNFKQEKKAVLGLDIYKYSNYDTERQNLIPFVFDIIKDEATKHVKLTEKTFFPLEYENKFISTGDGGFMIFETPLHALLFNLHFYSVLQLFNTGHFFPKLSQYIGELIIRCTITYDNIYFYEGNYYGKAIITNARILSKDKLNRFLVDKNFHDYFIRYFNGIETLSIITINNVKRILKLNEDISSWFIYKENENIQKSQLYIDDRIRNIHVQKIEDLFEKEAQLIIYNIEIQILIAISDDYDPNKITEYIFSIGNTNAIR